MTSFRQGLWILPITAIAVLLAPNAWAAEGDLAVNGGVPLRLAGEVDARAASAHVILDPASLSSLQLAGTEVTLRHVTVHSEFAMLPTGELVRVEQLVSERTASVTPPVLSVFSPSPDAYAIATGPATLTTSRPLPDARDAWAEGDAQVTTLVKALRVAPPTRGSVTEFLESSATGPAGLELAPGTLETRAIEGTISMTVDEFVLFGAKAIANGDLYESAVASVVAPGGAYLPDPVTGAASWTGPGQHVEEDVVFTVANLVHASLALRTDSGSVGFYSSEVVVDVDGFAQFPWAAGRMRHGDAVERIDGNSILIQGVVQLRPVGIDLDGGPAVSYLGSGDFELVDLSRPVSAATPAQVAVVAGGAGLAAVGVAAAVYYWPFLKYVAGTFLYARLPRDKILDHRGRGMVYDMVRAEPGVSTHRLAESVEFGWSTLMYHLRVLERTEKIVSVRDGRYKRFFDRESGKFANGRKFVVAVLKNEATYSIAQHILARPGITQKELSGLLGLAPSSIHWHVERLASAGLLEKRRDGHNIRYYPGSAWSDVSPQDLQGPAAPANDAAVFLDNPFAPALVANPATGVAAAPAGGPAGPVPPTSGRDTLLR